MAATVDAYTPRVAARIASSADKIVSSRMLALQSKRLLLAVAENRLAKTDDQEVHKRAISLREDVLDARHDYLTAVLLFGSPDTAEYQLAAYSSLLDAGDRLTAKLRAAVSDLGGRDRYEVETEIEVLEQLIQRWRAAICTSMKILRRSEP